ncbi:hypothetical protein [Pseudooctadecabacter jejudonensis]|uniref:Flagellar protein FliT n=1 Tax=Pseudooctadecabacter jejudonensis TaxID=1391910 RepID=A0A1Y5TEV1_9RHOB|nr:hypothetical protein [Pseudooctadecabacter jejudonensis]SLN62314.1 hypothetical protein PSJ8397_03309 [Pseudooctadecabacter jejudonensis]
MADNQSVKRKILNALSDLYFIQRHNDDLTTAQKDAIATSITALEAEYIALGGRAPDGAYDAIGGHLSGASASLAKIKAEREELATTYASAAKILGSVSRILALLA